MKILKDDLDNVIETMESIILPDKSIFCPVVIFKDMESKPVMHVSSASVLELFKFVSDNYNTYETWAGSKKRNKV